MSDEPLEEKASSNINDNDLRRQTLNRASRFGLVVGFIAAFGIDAIILTNLLLWSHPSKLVIPNTSIPDSVEGIIALIGISVGTLVTGASFGYFIAKCIVKRRYFNFSVPQSPATPIENNPRRFTVPLYSSDELKRQNSDDANRIDELNHIDSDGDNDSIYKEVEEEEEAQKILVEEDDESPSP